MGGLRALLSALRFLECAAQLGDTAAGLTFSAKLPAFIGKHPQMSRCFRAKRIKASRKFCAIFGRIGDKPRRRLLREGGR